MSESSCSPCYRLTAPHMVAMSSMLTTCVLGSHNDVKPLQYKSSAARAHRHQTELQKQLAALGEGAWRHLMAEIRSAEVLPFMHQLGLTTLRHRKTGAAADGRSATQEGCHSEKLR